MKPIIFYYLLLIFILQACDQINTNKDKPIADTNTVNTDTLIVKTTPVVPAFTYHFIKKKDWQALKDSFEGAAYPDILNAINRVDAKHLKRLDSILVPSDYSQPLEHYLPFPQEVDFLKDVNKIILFSYPAQVFAAYENGKMILTGPTSMGRKTKPTPQKLYFANWKAKRTVSTVDDAWILNWNFNVHNTWGVGFHEYELPGYPASHSCMRLLEKDAKFLYGWADQWILKNGQLAAAGTPVIVFGKYPFGEARPWYKLAEDPSALTIHSDSLKQYIEPHLPEIIQKQEQRKSIVNN